LNLVSADFNIGSRRLHRKRAVLRECGLDGIFICVGFRRSEGREKHQRGQDSDSAERGAALGFHVDVFN